jgi:LuxR family maltose regulon positive regulatory protein
MNEITGQEDSMHARVMYLGMGNILREWNELERATQMLLKGIEGCQQLGETFLEAVGYQYFLRVRLAQGLPDEAQVLLEKVKEVLQHRQTTIPFRFTLSNYQVSIWLAQGKLENAIEWAQRLEQEHVTGFLEVWNVLILVRVLLAQARAGKVNVREHSLYEAFRLTEEIHQTAAAYGRASQVIDALSLQALVLWEQGKRTEALAVLQRAVERAEPEGYIRSFADEGPSMANLLRRLQANGVAPAYLARVLGAFERVDGDQGATEARQPGQIGQAHAMQVKTPPVLLEPLSERELQVLALIAEGHSNEEIGRQLYVSVGTVKTHLKHIYGKLEVHTRTQAVARARELYLLSSR